MRKDKRRKTKQQVKNLVFGWTFGIAIALFIAWLVLAIIDLDFAFLVVIVLGGVVVLGFGVLLVAAWIADGLSRLLTEDMEDDD